MDPNNRILPLHRLPPGFTQSFEARGKSPASPRPAATLLLLRKGTPGPEVLLLRRSPRAGFVPGAYVFPGGQVDAADGHRTLFGRLDGLTESQARELLGRNDAGLPAAAFWVAALRETFEETGIFIGRDSHGNLASCYGLTPDGWSGGGTLGERLAPARSRLLTGAVSFPELLESFDLVLDAAAVRYIGHWVTPESEPRRFDTRFFGACAPPDCSVELDPGEMVEALWLTPSQALDRNRAGQLPLVFPTLRTLEDLEGYTDPHEALDSLARRPIPRLVPRMSRAEGGIRFEVPR